MYHSIRASKVPSAIVIALMIILFGSVHASSPMDIEQSWAQEHIDALIQEGVIVSGQGDLFRPNDALTRADLADWAVKAFRPVPVQDVVYDDISHDPRRRAIVNFGRSGTFYTDGTWAAPSFFPEKPVTRGELFATIVRLLDVGDFQTVHEPSFLDVTPHDGIYHLIQTAKLIGLIPPYIDGVFQPNIEATRAEAAFAINQALNLELRRGTVRSVNPESAHIEISSGDREIVLRLAEDTLVYRDHVPARLDHLRSGDSVYFVSDRFNTPKIVSVRSVDERFVPQVSSDGDHGQNTGQSDILSGLITPHDISAALSGDWDQLKNNYVSKLIHNLTERGLSREEAEAVVNLEWDNIQKLAESEIGSVIGDQAGLNDPLVQSLLSGEWESLREFVRNEVLNSLIQLLSTDQV